MMAPINSSSLLALLAVASSPSSTCAFTAAPRGSFPSSSTTSLQATAQAQESFQRSLLAARIAYESSAKPAVEVSNDDDAAAAVVLPEETKTASAAAVAPSTKTDAKTRELFQRSLLAARIANDARSAAVISASVVAPEEDAKEEEEEEEEVEAAAPIAVVEEAVEDDEEIVVEEEESEPIPETEPKPEPEPEPEPIVMETEPATANLQEEPPSPIPSEPIPTSTTTTTASSTPPPKPTTFTIPRELAIVPINESSVQFTAGLLGATAGYLLGGPLFAAVFAATTNYLSRKDDEPKRGDAVATTTSPKKIVDTASQTVLLFYNYLAQFERENRVFDTTFRLLEGTVDKAKRTEQGEIISNVENVLGTVARTAEELNDDYDLVGGAGTVLNSVGDLVEISVDKVVELDGEYRLSQRVGDVVKGTLGKFVSGVGGEAKKE